MCWQSSVEILLVQCFWNCINFCVKWNFHSYKHVNIACSGVNTIPNPPLPTKEASHPKPTEPRTNIDCSFIYTSNRPIDFIMKLYRAPSVQRGVKQNVCFNSTGSQLGKGEGTERAFATTEKATTRGKKVLEIILHYGNWGRLCVLPWKEL